MRQVYSNSLGVTQRVAATVPRVEISRADPITHVQPMPGPSSRTVLGMHLVYSQPEMFKLKINILSHQLYTLLPRLTQGIKC